MIQDDGINFWVDHGFDQNSWALCWDKIFMGLIINGETLHVLIPVLYWLYSLLPPLIYVGHYGLNKRVKLSSGTSGILFTITYLDQKISGLVLPI